jgi:hypothetical protein
MKKEEQPKTMMEQRIAFAIIYLGAANHGITNPPCGLIGAPSG